MSNITNNYAVGSCNFASGSSQNGDIHIESITINKPGTSPQIKPCNELQQSPIYLSAKAKKIDLIRIANAMYELGMVADAKGAQLTKKEFMTAFGQTFNVDLSNYSNDLSNSMVSSVAYEKQTLIFDQMKQKFQEIYNRK